MIYNTRNVSQHCPYRSQNRWIQWQIFSNTNTNTASVVNWKYKHLCCIFLQVLKWKWNYEQVLHSNVLGLVFEIQKFFLTYYYIGIECWNWKILAIWNTVVNANCIAYFSIGIPDGTSFWRALTGQSNCTILGDN